MVTAEGIQKLKKAVVEMLGRSGPEESVKEILTSFTGGGVYRDPSHGIDVELSDSLIKMVPGLSFFVKSFEHVDDCRSAYDGVSTLVLKAVLIEEGDHTFFLACNYDDSSYGDHSFWDFREVEPKEITKIIWNKVTKGETA